VCEEHLCQCIGVGYCHQECKCIRDWVAFEGFIPCEKIVDCGVGGSSHFFFQQAQHDFVGLVHFLKTKRCETPHHVFFMWYKVKHVFLDVSVCGLLQCEVEKWVVLLDSS